VHTRATVVLSQGMARRLQVDPVTLGYLEQPGVMGACSRGSRDGYELQRADRTHAGCRAFPPHLLTFANAGRPIRASHGLMTARVSGRHSGRGCWLARH
jgi:hypothetical protein